MSLDQNLFTLNITPREGDPLVTELIDPSGTAHYRKVRTQNAGGLYEFSLFEPLYESLLATVTAPSATSKHKTVELHNPSVPVELKYTGTFTFRWSFKWEEHEFEWKREECFLIRKPDPPVLVAITKEPPGKIKTKSVQILDYNLQRFDINDRKGLEIVLLSALLSFQDYSEDIHGRKEDSTSSTPSLLGTPATKTSKTPEVTSPPPELPPKPQKTGVEKVAEMQTGELGEVTVEADGLAQDYAQYCANLLEGEETFFVILRSSSALTVPKVLEIAHQTKRIRHKQGLDEELYQYVQYDTEKSTGKKGPRIIKLDDDAEEKDRYKPPESLTVHLSKIPLPELQPKVKEKSKEKGKNKDKEASDEDLKEDKSKAKNKSKEKEESEKERKKREKEEEKERQRREKENKKNKRKNRARSLDRDERGAMNSTLAKPPPPPQPNVHIPPHMVHPNQPSPSPSQLNNPMVYAAPTPVPPRPPLLSPQGHYPTYPTYPTHLRTGPSPQPPMNYPIQRPVSAYGPYLGPPQHPPPQQRAQSPGSGVTGLLDKLKSW
ncbi:uncharacterized protein FOMMEDRAFT_164351 [Fomitiporia mediterranea MF3/22]|uniref:uncharacterized protein n=1 Tax=Fomitiporia mediterranea (strain MF3/22) TaxID=694068 RepID=UPI00044075AB|nr:uncharacterized protein FOMMEDRAFT_164351 [Fomitiporia mediterranea MF3/22]EJD07364.1 hypothetical protein FOMMEDRAFT_164351 [Fomitiporia mediterranea MF3/22]